VSTLLRPTGPLPPGAYWVRRLLVLLVVFVVLVGGWWVFLRSDPTPAPADSTPPLASDTATPTPSDSTTPSESGSPSASPSSSPAQPDCARKAIEVGVTTDQPDYPGGVEPVFTLTVKNVGDVTCRRDVGQRALELTVTSGDVRVWSSDDCNPGGPSAVRVFGPGDQYVLPVTWSRQLSEAGCPTGEPLADPGQYQVVARDLDVSSQPASFTLS